LLVSVLARRLTPGIYEVVDTFEFSTDATLAAGRPAG
jgi:hypothetical protein